MTVPRRLPAETPANALTELGPSSRAPGLLLKPFGWAAEPVLRLALHEPRLMAHLADLDALRMHAIAFYLSQQREGTLNAADAAVLASAPSRKILRSALGQQHWGLMGLLRRLPDQVLGRTAYKLLSDIASNETLVRALLVHSKLPAKALTASYISALAAIPPELLGGPLVRAVGYDTIKLTSVAGVCAWLARRWNIQATTRFAAARNIKELRRLTYDHIRMLPPSPRLSPRHVGHAHLLETPKEMRQAGRLGRNCLGRYDDHAGLFGMLFGSRAFYVWEDDDAPIYIGVRGSIGLGWFLSSMKVADNRDPPADRSRLVERAFEEAGIEPGDIEKHLTHILIGHDAWDLS